MSSGERPKLNLAPRTLPTAVGTAARPTESAAKQDTGASSNDKWDTVFKGSRPVAGGDARNMPRGDARSREYEVEDDRFQSFGRDRGSSGRDGSRSLSKEIDAMHIIKEDSEKKVDPKKAAKAAARAEEEKKAKLEKEAAQAAKEAAIVAEKEAIAASKSISQDIISKGIKGLDLVAHVQGMETKPEAPSLVAELLSQIAEPTSSPGAAVKWCVKGEYGHALTSLLAGNDQKQMFTLYEVQRYCDGLKFPKIEVKGEKRNLIEIIFQVMYANEIVDHAGFMAWADDDNEEIPGKLTAVVQTTNFIAMLNEVSDGEGEEDEDDEVDAPMATI